MNGNVFRNGFYSAVLLFGVFSVANSCTDDSVKKTSTPTASTTQKPVVKQDSAVQPEIVKVPVKYTTVVFPKQKKDSAIAAFNKEFSEQERYLILAVNRLDSKNKRRADTLVIPDVRDNILKLTPFPVRLDKLKDVKKIAFFAYPIHAYALYENGNLIKWGPSSMGKKATPTKRGLMFTNWKKEEAISTSNSEWKLRWNFNIHNSQGIGWHQYELPGRHASHSCLRLLEEDAKWMYSWADQWVLSEDRNTTRAKGTPVIVFGESDFKSRPWLKLAQDPAANDLSEEQMNAVFGTYLPEILSEQQNSEKIRAEIAAKKAAASARPETETAAGA